MERKGFIGGSDMRRIMEGDWLSLWQEKTGRVMPDDLSDVLPVQMGVQTERFNKDWFAKQHTTDECETIVTGFYSDNEQQEVYGAKTRGPTAEMNWEGVPLKGTVDGFIWIDRVYEDEIIECKHTYEGNSMENCLKMYMPQMQFYMWVHQAKGCYLSVFFGNRRWESVYVQKDWKYIDQMKVHLVEFWKCVSQDQEPASNAVPPVSIDKIKVDGMVKRDASSDNEFISRCHDYIETETNAKLFESAKSDLKAMVGDDEREVYCDLLTIKRDKRGALRITVKEN